MDVSVQELLSMHEKLLTARIFTEKMHKAVNAGMIRSSFHTPLGQEAAGVGIVRAMADIDWLAPNHRLQPALLSRLEPYRLIAEIFGKADGTQHGAAFDFHCCDFQEGKVLPFDGILGSTVPAYTGFAWGLKLQKKPGVVVIVIGDGAASEGAVYEGWNIASLYKPPVVYVIDNNKWAMTVPLERQSANENISERAVPLGLPARRVDGYDVLEIRKAMEAAIEQARMFNPNVVEIQYRRWDAHFVGQGNEYRDDSELVKYDIENNDPVKKFNDYMLEKGYIKQEDIAALTAKISNEMDEMIKKADACPPPAFEQVYRKDYIYATPVTGGEL